ncbi:mutator type transposase [Tanacetum coccineum]
MANVFPCAEHRSCLRHIHENMKKQWNGQAYKELLWRCASVTTVPYFDKAMQDLKDFNKECFEWLAKIPPHSWSRSYFSGCLNGRVMWKKSQIPTTLTPPKYNTPVGRPRKNRRKSKEEKAEMVKDGKLSRAYKTVTCMKCGNLGHNSRSCKGQKDPYTGTSQTTPSTAPAKKPSDAGTRKRPSDAPAPSTAPAKMNQATKKQCAMSN